MEDKIHNCYSFFKVAAKKHERNDIAMHANAEDGRQNRTRSLEWKHPVSFFLQLQMGRKAFIRLVDCTNVATA